jgi:AcrR family transcriptional regulator
MPKSSDQDPTTRDLLIEATLGEIADRGWGAVRTRSVAARAGVNKALVHYHFGSIENLRLEAAATAFARLAGSFSPDSVDLSDLGSAVSDLSERIGTVQMDDPIWQVLSEVFLQAPRDPRLTEMANRLLGVYRLAIAAIVTDDVARGRLPADTDAEGVAVAMTAMLDGLALHAYVDRDLDVARAGRAIARLLTPMDHTTRRKDAG